MSNTISSKITGKSQTSGKSNMSSLFNMATQFNKIKNGSTGGERLLAMWELLHGITSGTSGSSGTSGGTK